MNITNNDFNDYETEGGFLKLNKLGWNIQPTETILKRIKVINLRKLCEKYGFKINLVKDGMYSCTNTKEGEVSTMLFPTHENYSDYANIVKFILEAVSKSTKLPIAILTIEALKNAPS